MPKYNIEDLQNYDTNLEDKKVTQNILPLTGQDFIDKDVNIKGQPNIFPLTEAVGQQFLPYGVEEIDKKLSINDLDNIPAARAERQSTGSKILGTLNKALIGEVLGGTLEGIGHFADIPQTINALEGETQEWGNWLTDLGKDMRTWSEEATPVYTDPANQGKFNPWTSDWWYNNAPSMASTLSLMIPSAGIVKGASLLGKAMGIAGKLGKTAKFMVTGIGQATASRLMENGMEALGNYDQTLQELLDKGTDEETAKKVASEAASKTWKANWAMLAQDIPQYLLLNKAFPKATGDLTRGTAKALGKSTLAPTLSKAQAIGLDMLGESGEEAYQYIVNEESRYLAEVNAGLRDESDFGERLNNYLKDGEFWTSATIGALGGGVMQVGGKSLNTAITRLKGQESQEDRRINNIKGWASQRRLWEDQIKAKKDIGDSEGVVTARNGLIRSMGIQAAQNGNLGAFKDSFKVLTESEQLDPETAQLLDVTEEEFPEVKKNAKDYIAKLDLIENLYNDNITKYSDDLAAEVTNQQVLLQDLTDHKDALDPQINKLQEELEELGELSTKGRAIHSYTLRKHSFLKTQEINNKRLENDKNLTKEDVSKIKAENKELENSIQELDNSIAEERKDYDPKERSNDNKLIKEINKKERDQPLEDELVKKIVYKSLLDKTIKDTKQRILQYQTKSFQKKFEEAKKQKDINTVKEAINAALTPEEIATVEKETKGTPAENPVKNTINTGAKKENPVYPSTVKTDPGEETVTPISAMSEKDLFSVKKLIEENPELSDEEKEVQLKEVNTVLESKVKKEDNAVNVIIEKDKKSKWNLKVQPNGDVININTNESLDKVKNKKLINKAHLKSGHLPYKKVSIPTKNKDKKLEYAVTEDNRIINITKNSSSAGNELSIQSAYGKKILNLAKDKDYVKIDVKDVDSLEKKTTPIPQVQTPQVESIYKDSPKSFIVDKERIVKRAEQEFKDNPLYEAVANTIANLKDYNEFKFIQQNLDYIYQAAAQGNEAFKRLQDVIDTYFTEQSKKKSEKFKEQEEGTQEILDFLEDNETLTTPENYVPVPKEINPFDVTIKDRKLDEKDPRKETLIFTSKDSQKRLNWSLLNKPGTFPANTEVEYEVVLDEDWAPGNEGITPNNFQVQIISYKENKQGNILGVLPILDNVSSNIEGREDLKALRELIWEKVKEHKETSKSNILKTGIKTTISKKHNGRIWTTNKYYEPNDIVKGTDTPIRYAIITTEGEVKKAVGFSEARDEFLDKAEVGAVYMILPASNGELIPLRMFTKKISEFNKGDKLFDNKFKQDVYNKILQIFEKGASFKDISKAIKETAYLNFTVDYKGFNGDGAITLFKNKEPFNFNIKELRAEDNNNTKLALSVFLDDLVLQVDKRVINNEDLEGNSLNPTLSERLKINVNPGEWMHSTRFTVNNKWTESKSPVKESGVKTEPVITSDKGSIPTPPELSKDFSESVGMPKELKESLENKKKSINFDEITLESLYPEGLPTDLNVDEVFSEQDKKDAEDIMEYCKGLTKKQVNTI